MYLFYYIEVYYIESRVYCTFLRVFKNPHCCDIGILLELLVRLDDSDALVVVIECDIKKDLSFMVDHS